MDILITLVLLAVAFSFAFMALDPEMYSETGQGDGHDSSDCA